MRAVYLHLCLLIYIADSHRFKSVITAVSGLVSSTGSSAMARSGQHSPRKSDLFATAVQLLASPRHHSDHPGTGPEIGFGRIPLPTLASGPLDDARLAGDEYAPPSHLSHDLDIDRANDLILFSKNDVAPVPSECPVRLSAFSKPAKLSAFRLGRRLSKVRRFDYPQEFKTYDLLDFGAEIPTSQNANSKVPYFRIG